MGYKNPLYCAINRSCPFDRTTLDVQVSSVCPSIRLQRSSFARYASLRMVMYRLKAANIGLLGCNILKMRKEKSENVINDALCMIARGSQRKITVV